MSLNPQTGPETCLHCGQAVPSGMTSYCCQGCAIVARLLREADLTRFYELKPKNILPMVNYFTRQADFAWLERAAPSGVAVLDIEGVQCAACIWVIREVARRLNPETRVDVDVVLGRITLTYDPSTFDLKKYAETLFKFGYRLKNPKLDSKKENNGLLLRLGICAAISMNTMFLAISLYVGLGQSDAVLYRLFTEINFYLSLLAVIVGGSYFFNKAYLSLRGGILHFDLSISIGILAAFLGSMALHFQNRGGEAYFDTLNIFITLMLAGRYVQERVIQKNRNSLLMEDELSQMRVTRVGEVYSEIAFNDIRRSDHLLLQSGGLVPVECVLDSESADFSIAWISGESMPVSFKKGASVPAGAQLVSHGGAFMTAVTSYEGSPIKTLKPKYKEEAFLPVVWKWFIARYVLIVLSAAVAGFAVWSFIDSSRALNVLTSILVVTCPCSLGVAIPLARVMADHQLRRWGVFIRGGAVLDKLLGIRGVFFDKTGTLTLAQLEWVNRDEVRLSPHDEEILYNMTAQSRHPASQSIYQSLSERRIPARRLEISEIPGRGLRCDTGGETYWLGRFHLEAQAADSERYGVRFYKNESLLGEMMFEEKILENASGILQRLAERGLELFLISGDHEARVRRIGAMVGIKNCYARLSPQDKAEIVSAKSRGDALVIGDGLNDSKAFEAATLCGTPLWDHSTMASGADFYYLSARLDWLLKLFETARRLQQTIRMNLVFSFVFNFLAVGLAFSGRMSPLMAAVLMPAGSLVILTMTIRKMRKGA